ncbi:MAG: phosphatase PAP2 family protein [Anaerolineae bacterium]|nr:phosphatase PAP2 family protein [Anaerolineae bacterium]
MSAENTLDDGLSINLPEFIPSWDRRVAKIISNVANPALLASCMVLLAAAFVRGTAAWTWAWIGIITNILVPVAFILWMLKRGNISDFDIYYREQRKLPYLVTLSCSMVTVTAMLIGGAPMIFVIIIAASLTQMMIMFLINRRWKISAHAAGMASFSMFLFHSLGVTALPALFGIPLMIWSRVRLKRHTLFQTLAGSALGIIVFFSFLTILAD